MDDKNLQYKRELGLNIKHYRLKSNYTQEQLAEKIGIGPKHLSRLETAKIGISLDTLFDIADALEIEPYLLLKFRYTAAAEPRRFPCVLGNPSFSRISIVL